MISERAIEFFSWFEYLWPFSIVIIPGIFIFLRVRSNENNQCR